MVCSPHTPLRRDATRRVRDHVCVESCDARDPYRDFTDAGMLLQVIAWRSELFAYVCNDFQILMLISMLIYCWYTWVLSIIFLIFSACKIEIYSFIYWKIVFCIFLNKGLTLDRSKNPWIIPVSKNKINFNLCSICSLFFFNSSFFNSLRKLKVFQFSESRWKL